MAALQQKMAEMQEHLPCMGDSHAWTGKVQMWACLGSKEFSGDAASCRADPCERQSLDLIVLPFLADSLWQIAHQLHLRLTLGSEGRLPVPWGRCCVSSGSPLMRGKTLIFSLIMLTLHCRSDETADSP